MENCCSRSLLSCLISLILLVQLSTEQFQVLGPLNPTVAVLGGDAILPCSLSPAMNAENMELRWFRSRFSQAVLVYWNQREQNEEQMAEYTGRTSLVKDFLTQGQAAVHIHKVRVSDSGMYTCFFRMGSFYEEADLELKVAGMGSDPQVHIEGPEEDGVRVSCLTSGWFPKPQVQWTDISGKKLPAFSEAHTQDTEQLFNVETTLVVRDSSVGNVTCSVLNPILGQEKAMAIFIPEPFFPQASPWKPVFFIILVLLGLLSFGAAYFIQKEHSTKMQVRQEKENLQCIKEKDRQTREEALKAADELQADLSQRKAAYLSGWRKAHLYADWRKEQFQAWPVTLDPTSAHPWLAISHERRHLTWKDNCPFSTGSYSVLGLEGITSGRCYWEVEIKSEDKSCWALGVCREDVKRTGVHRISPKMGVWVLGQIANRYYAGNVIGVSHRQDPCRVGVFLDYSEGDVSFYNMNDGSHIFSFPPDNFSGTVFPYFMLISGDVSMTVCSMESDSEGLPVLINNSPSLEETLSTPREGFSSGSGVDGDPQRAESPLLPCHSETLCP